MVINSRPEKCASIASPKKENVLMESIQEFRNSLKLEKREMQLLLK